MNRFGLAQHHIAELAESFKAHFTQGTVILYGSRAKGNFTERSDINLVIRDAGTLDRHILATIQDEIDESDVPYLCDIQYFEDIRNTVLREHIVLVGQVLLSITYLHKAKAISK